MADGQWRVLATILSALGLSACGGSGDASEAGADDISTTNGIASVGTSGGLTSNADDASCGEYTREELLCVDPLPGDATTTTLTSESSGSTSESSGGASESSGGASESSSGSSESSSGSSETIGESGDPTGGHDLCPDVDPGDAAALCGAGDTVDLAEGGPTMVDGQCCFTVLCGSIMCSGRPFVVAAVPRLAAVRRRDDWLDAPRPNVAMLGTDVRAELAAAWLADARAEHASVASFARFALELLSIGAPPDLVDDAHAAARDEIDHARICFALASGYAGEPHGPGPLAVEGALDRCGDLYAIIRATVEEGCVCETLAAIEAEAAIGHAADPAVRSALIRIAGDEARHAALAWRVIAWALGTGAHTVRRAVLDGLAAAEPMLALRIAETPLADRDGRLGRERRADVVRTAWRDVLAPLGEQLLAS